MSEHSSILKQIQSLSNERQRLYSQKWSARNRPGYRERIKRLDEQLADLWHSRRMELAGPPPLAAQPYAVEHFSEVETDVRPVESFADLLDQVGVQVLMEVLAELREDDDARATVPLRTVFARRKRTLAWMDIGRGRFASREVTLSAPS